MGYLRKKRKEKSPTLLADDREVRLEEEAGKGYAVTVILLSNSPSVVFQ